MLDKLADYVSSKAEPLFDFVEEYWVWILVILIVAVLYIIFWM